VHAASEVRWAIHIAEGPKAPKACPIWNLEKIYIWKSKTADFDAPNLLMHKETKLLFYVNTAFF
jgi:hypothetical protein